jgi:gas vesicle protein
MHSGQESIQIVQVSESHTHTHTQKKTKNKIKRGVRKGKEEEKNAAVISKIMKAFQPVAYIGSNRPLQMASIPVEHHAILLLL